MTTPNQNASPLTPVTPSHSYSLPTSPPPPPTTPTQLRTTRASTPSSPHRASHTIPPQPLPPPSPRTIRPPQCPRSTPSTPCKPRPISPTSSPSPGPPSGPPPFTHLSPAQSQSPVPETRIQLCYDPANFYVASFLHDPHVCATITQQNTPIFMDNDFEIFLDPDADGQNYYEFEVNPLGTTWQLCLDRPYSQGGSAESPCELPGLESHVRVYGTLNDPTDIDRGWSVGVSIPFESLRRFGSAVPPGKGHVWKANFSRVQWVHDIVHGKYVRVPPHGTPLPQGADQQHPEMNIVWAPTGVLDIHRPEHWGFLKFG